MAKLTKLTLENYRNLPSLTIVFDGLDGKITGANRIGKTNCLEAICYLLTDKLLGGSADIPSIKPHDNPRAHVVVEGTFVTDDGEVTIRKEFYEKWVRPRGSANEELQGHATDYYINGAKQARAKDFFDSIQSKFGIPTDLNGMDAIQLVIDPFYLGEFICGSKDWKLARKTVIEIVGDPTPEEIYAENKDAEIAKEDLEAHQFDDTEAKKAIRGEIDGYKKQMTINEGLLQEYDRAANQDVTDEEHENARALDEQYNEQIAKLKLGAENPYADEVSKLNAELFELQKRYQQTLATQAIDHSESERIREEIRVKKNQYMNLDIKARTEQISYEKSMQELRQLIALQNEYKAKLKALAEEDKSIMVESVCQTCGQQLPEEMVQEAFNRKKAEISAEAQRIRGLAIENKKRIELLQALEEHDYSPELSKLQAELTELEKALARAIESEKAQVKTPDPKIAERIAQINQRLAELRALSNSNNQSTLAQIEAIKAKRVELQAIFSKRIAAQNAIKRIAEIREQNSKISKKLSDAEQRLWAVGEFVKTKLSLLDKHMAERLGEVRFQLIKENIKAGSYDEVCVPYIISPLTGKATKTLFPDGSKSEQIYTGIQIIRAIRDVKGWNPLPILFDQGGELDAESTAKVSYDAEAQIIEVKVEVEATKPTFVPFAN